MTDQETKRMQEIDAHIANLNAETAKLIAQTRYPPVVIAALVIAALQITAQVISALA